MNAPTRRRPRRRTHKDFPVEDVRRFLEPGPIVLVSSAFQGRRNIMTMGWHAVMAFSPSLVGCVIASSNHSHAMIRRSRECVINIPEASMADVVSGIGTCSGARVDKFERFGLDAAEAEAVQAPLLPSCFASFECRVADTRLVKPYDFFVLEVVKAHVAVTPRHPKTLHYRGGGVFTLSGETRDLGRRFPVLRRM